MNSFPSDPDKAAVIIHADQDQNRTYTWRELQGSYRDGLSLTAGDDIKAISTDFPERYYGLRITCPNLEMVFLRGELENLVIENCPHLHLLSLPSSLKSLVLNKLSGLETFPFLPSLKTLDLDSDLFVRFIAQLKSQIAPEILVRCIANTVDPGHSLQMIRAYGSQQYDHDFRSVFGEPHTFWRH